jgi:phospholipid/cholesterol/gamma-HCH transport system permease protein
MRLNEEIDAMTTIGLSPMQVLVLPRLLALIIAMPLLVFVGDVIGIIGGMLIAEIRLDITGTTFIERLRTVLPLRSVLVGIIKAPVFAAFIAVIGCRMGLNVEKNARSVGLSTTSTVVQSIVSVIILNAIFAVIFVELGI